MWEWSWLVGVLLLGVLAYSVIMIFVCCKTPAAKNNVHRCTVFWDMILYWVVCVSMVLNVVAGIMFTILVTDHGTDAAGYWAIGLFWGAFVLMLIGFGLGVYVIENNQPRYATVVEIA